MMKCCFKLVDRIPATLEKKKTASRMSDNEALLPLLMLGWKK
jgi:hypothetical protein